MWFLEWRYLETRLFFLCSDNQSLVLISSLDELSKISRFICLPRFYFVFLPFFPWNLVYVISMEPLSINNFYSCIILCVTVRWLFSMEDLLVLVGFDVRTKITSVQNAALLFCLSNKCLRFLFCPFWFVLICFCSWFCHLVSLFNCKQL